MKINVIKRKANSYRDLSKEKIEVGEPKTIIELLKNIMIYQSEELHSSLSILNNDEVNKQAKSGKVFFETYGNKPEIENMMNTLIQDFEDGLFRVYLNDEEQTDLYKDISLNEEDTLILIKLIMLTGRLW